MEVVRLFAICSAGLPFIALHPLMAQPPVRVPPGLGHGYEFAGNGKEQDAPPQAEILIPWPAAVELSEALARNDPGAKRAMEFARKYLSTRKASRAVGSIELGDGRLLRTLDQLMASQDVAGLTLYRIKGEDGRGNVHFTGYFTPVISASPSESDVFRYPLYRMPAAWDGGRPTREQIDAGGALAGKGLELAWTDDLVGNYIMQVQGSGFVRFGDGSQLLLMYAGTNGYPYSSIGKYLVSMGQIPASEISLGAITRWLEDHPDGVQDVLFRNKSYNFFMSAGDHPVGAGDMQLVAGHSIAADPAFLPFGAVVLGKVPVLDADGRLIRHEYRLLVVQDRGGAIKGPGHVDLYEGVGDEAGLRAGPLHHYGALWLLLTR